MNTESSFPTNTDAPSDDEHRGNADCARGYPHATACPTCMCSSGRPVRTGNGFPFTWYKFDRLASVTRIRAATRADLIIFAARDEG